MSAGAAAQGLRAAAANPAIRVINHSNAALTMVPGDAILNAIGLGDLTLLAMKCRLDRSYLRDEASMREGLCKYRDDSSSPDNSPHSEERDGSAFDEQQ